MNKNDQIEIKANSSSNVLQNSGQLTRESHTAQVYAPKKAKPVVVQNSCWQSITSK